MNSTSFIQSFKQFTLRYGCPDHSNQVTTVINCFWNKWRYEYLVNLREPHKYYFTNKNQPFIRVNNVGLVHSDKAQRLKEKGIIKLEES